MSGLFGQANQQSSTFNKPFGTATTQSGGLFGTTTPAFGATTATPAFGATNTPGFGATTNQNNSIGLFGQQNQAGKFMFFTLKRCH